MSHNIRILYTALPALLAIGLFVVVNVQPKLMLPAIIMAVLAFWLTNARFLLTVMENQRHLVHATLPVLMTIVACVATLHYAYLMANPGMWQTAALQNVMLAAAVMLTSTAVVAVHRHVTRFPHVLAYIGQAPYQG